MIENAFPGANASVIGVEIVASELAHTGFVNSLAHSDKGALRTIGIYMDGGSGAIIGNTITGIHFDDNLYIDGIGIWVANSPYDGTLSPTTEVTISGNEISEFQRGGIVVMGAVDATIHANIITGDGKDAEHDAFGIEIAFGATASVKRNMIYDIWTGGTGIVIFETDDVIVQGNTISDTQTAIAVQTDGQETDGAYDNKIIRNTIEEASSGIVLFQSGHHPEHDSNIENTKITNNTITCLPEDGVPVFQEGIWFTVESWEDYYVMYPDPPPFHQDTGDIIDTKVINNKLGDNCSFLADDLGSGDPNSGTDAKVHANSTSD